MELFYPFSVDSTGALASTADPDIVARQHVESLVGTSPGERVMLPDYGIPASSYVFENGEDTVIAGLTNDIEQAMAFWEPNITVLSVQPNILSGTDGYGIASIDVDFTQEIPSANNSVNTATVFPGGKVIQIVIANAT